MFSALQKQYDAESSSNCSAARFPQTQTEPNATDWTGARPRAPPRGSISADYFRRAPDAS